MHDLHELISTGQIGGCYMMHISVRTGRSKISLESDRFKAEDISAALQTNGVKSKDILPLLEVPIGVYYTAKQAADPNFAGAKSIGRKSVEFGIETVAIQLRNALMPIRRHMISMNGGRWWVFAGGSKDLVEQSIDSVQALRDRLVEDLTLVYEQGQMIFEARTRAVLSSINASEEDIEYYLGQALTLEEIQQNIELVIEGPIEIPSLSKIAAVAPEFRAWMESTRSNLANELPKLDAQMTELIAAYMARMHASTVQDLEPRQKDILAEEYATLASLLQIRAELIGSSDELQQDAMSVLQFTLTNYPGADERGRHALRLKNQFVSHKYLDNPVSAGHRALRAWCGVITTDDAIANLHDRIHKFNQAESTDNPARAEELAQIQADCLAFSDSTAFRFRGLTKKLEGLQTSVNQTVKAEIRTAAKFQIEVTEAPEVISEISTKTKSRSKKSSKTILPEPAQEPAQVAEITEEVEAEAPEVISEISTKTKSRSKKSTTAEVPQVTAAKAVKRNIAKTVAMAGF